MRIWCQKLRKCASRRVLAAIQNMDDNDIVLVVVGQPRDVICAAKATEPGLEMSRGTQKQGDSEASVAANPGRYCVDEHCVLHHLSCEAL